MSTPIDAYAPYPKRPEDATAEAMLRHYAARVLVERGASSVYVARGEVERHVASVAARVDAYAAAHALRALIVAALDAADEAARHLWDTLEDGGDVTEWSATWLHELGLTSEQITALITQGERHATEVLEQDQR